MRKDNWVKRHIMTWSVKSRQGDHVTRMVADKVFDSTKGCDGGGGCRRSCLSASGGGLRVSGCSIA